MSKLAAILIALLLTSGARAEWFRYAPAGAVDGKGIYTEMMSRCPDWMMKQVRSFDKATQAHEATHGVNYEISKLDKQEYGAFYVGGGRCCVLPEPKVTIGQVARYVPQDQRTGRFKTYLSGDRVGRNCLSILDEFTCYANDATCTKELNLPDDGGLEFAGEFSGFADCLVKAVRELDPQYSRLKELVEFVEWQKKRVAELGEKKHGDAPIAQWGPQYKREQIAELAIPFRQRNRASSCVHASTVMELRWLHLVSQADQWWLKYRGGESAGPHRRKLEACGHKFLMTSNGDERVLEYAIASRRGAGVTWGGAHMVFFAGRVNGNVVLIDNNAIQRYKTQPWGEFLREWRNCGAWAFVILDGEVPPPTPVG